MEGAKGTMNRRDLPDISGLSGGRSVPPYVLFCTPRDTEPHTQGSASEISSGAGGCGFLRKQFLEEQKRQARLSLLSGVTNRARPPVPISPTSSHINNCSPARGGQRFSTPSRCRVVATI